jgi:hypothetical protein
MQLGNMSRRELPSSSFLTIKHLVRPRVASYIGNQKQQAFSTKSAALAESAVNNSHSLLALLPSVASLIMTVPSWTSWTSCDKLPHAFQRLFDHSTESITLALGNRGVVQDIDAPLLRLLRFATHHRIWLLGYVERDWSAARCRCRMECGFGLLGHLQACQTR